VSSTTSYLKIQTSAHWLSETSLPMMPEHTHAKLSINLAKLLIQPKSLFYVGCKLFALYYGYFFTIFFKLRTRGKLYGHLVGKHAIHAFEHRDSLFEKTRSIHAKHELRMMSLMVQTSIRFLLGFIYSTKSRKNLCKILWQSCFTSVFPSEQGLDVAIAI